MAQEHGDRLTAVDASFLAQEGPAAHMHVGAVCIFAGPAPSFGDFADHIRTRLHLVPRYRQKLAFPPLEAGRPLWIDDPTFNLEYHVRHTALPAPGDEDNLLRLAARIFSQRLDRSKPLWELWLVEGLDGHGDGEPGPGRFALISKSHHALVDGVSGADLGTVLFDVPPEGTRLSEVEPWVPRPEPTPAQLVARGIEDAARRAVSLAGGAVREAADPGDVLERAREVVEGVGEVTRAALNPPSPTPFNVAPGPHRRLAVVHAEL